MTRARDALLRVIARRCEGPLTVLTEDPGSWQAAGVECLPPERLEQAEPAGSLLIALDLKPLAVAERAALVARAWEPLREGASLLLLSPNPAACEVPESVPARREVNRLLRPCGRVHKWKDQPFRWLVFESVKRGADASGIDAEELARYEVTADLCRGRVLELGCGRGDLAGILLARGHEVTACDLASRKVKEAARRHPKGLFLHSDILELDLPVESFDTVLLPEVLEHVDAVVGDRLVDKAWSFVAPGGRFVVTVPNESCIPHANHVREFDRASLTGILSRLGEPVFSLDQPYKWLMASVGRP